jgi:hypothetical protein
MDSTWFEENVKPRLSGYKTKSSSFLNGDFGDLDRIELEGFNKLAGVEFWSKGWVGIDVYDCDLDSQLLNVLFSPEEKESTLNVFEKFIVILMQGSK